MSDIDVYKEWLGIPEGQRPPDYYTLLRLVQFEDDIDKIRANYRKLNAHVRKYSTGQYLLRSQELLNEMAKAMLCLTDPDGKLEYDAGLGRAPPESDNDEPTTVLQYLIAKNLIKRSQVSEIEHFAEARGLSPRDAVIQMKLAEPADATRALALELRLPYVDLEDMLPEDNVLDQVPRRIVKKHSCLPLFEDRGRFRSVTISPPDCFASAMTDARVGRLLPGDSSSFFSVCLLRFMTCSNERGGSAFAAPLVRCELSAAGWTWAFEKEFKGLGRFIDAIELEAKRTRPPLEPSA